MSGRSGAYNTILARGLKIRSDDFCLVRVAFLKCGGAGGVALPKGLMRGQEIRAIQAARNFACSHDYEEFNDTYGASASFAYGAISESGSYDQGNYKKFQNDYCKDSSKLDYQKGFEYYSRIDAGAGARGEWLQCMLNLAGFHCWAEPEAGDISIVLSQREPDKYKIRNSTLTGTVLASPAADTAKGLIIPFGQSRITIKRQGEQTVSFTLKS